MGRMCLCDSIQRDTDANDRRDRSMGGANARAVCRSRWRDWWRLAATPRARYWMHGTFDRLTLLGEVEPGLPYSVASCGGREILILTKAGGFGTRETLLRCREFLHKRERNSDAIEAQPSVRAGRTDMQKPIIAITMGDAAGVGPEIIMKSLAHREVYEQCRPLVIGDAERLRQAGRICASALEIRGLSTADIDRRHV